MHGVDEHVDTPLRGDGERELLEPIERREIGEHRAMTVGDERVGDVTT